MTETSPLCTFGGTGPQWQDASDQDIRTLKLKQGRPLFGVSARIASPDDAGATPGELLVKGPWIASRYFASDPSTEREWLATGDICEFDEHGYMAITDRAKDLIKSGGEWISSVELEEKACSVEGVAMAAAIAVPDEKWGERPLLAVVAKAGYDLDPSEIRATVGQGLAKWQVPERIEFLPEMPIGPTGKIIKAQLRERFCTTDS